MWLPNFVGNFPFMPSIMVLIVWKTKKSWFLLCGGSKITWKPPKSVFNHDLDHFEAFGLDQNHYFIKYLTFWKGPIYENSKKRKFREIFTFFQVLAPKIEERGISNPKICFKLRKRPPAEQNLAFFQFLRQSVRKYVGHFGYFSVFRKLKFGQKSGFLPISLF